MTIAIRRRRRVNISGEAISVGSMRRMVSHGRCYGRSGLFHIALDSHSRDDRHAIGTGRRYVDRVSGGASHLPTVRHDLRTKASHGIGSRWHSDVEGSAAVCRVVERGKRARPHQHDATWHAARRSWAMPPTTSSCPTTWPKGPIVPAIALAENGATIPTAAKTTTPPSLRRTIWLNDATIHPSIHPRKHVRRYPTGGRSHF